MAVRAKLTCTSITDSTPKTLRFNAVYDDSIPEDQRFQKATPAGHCELQIDNPKAIEQFKVGASYYVDFTPAG